jgi:hypothetical protein
MRPLVQSLAVLLAAVCGSAAAAGAEAATPHAPFVMPPSGKGEALVGGLDYPAPSALAFDRRNRPYMFNSRDAGTSGYLVTLRDGRWVRRSFAEAVKAACPRTHFVYGEIPPEGETGNPTVAATLDRRSGKVTARHRVATAAPERSDVHSTPVIARDGRGVLHVVAGAHGQPFLYTRSRAPDRVDAGWTAPSPLGRKATYAALVCDPADRLHLAYRRWESGRGMLAWQHKPAAGEAWADPRPVALPPEGMRGYGIFYHRLFIDRAGALYLSFTFNATKGGTYPRALAVSEDGGGTWRLADTETFRRRIAPAAGRPE